MSMFIKILIALSLLFFIVFLLLFWYFIISSGIRSIINSMKKRLP